MSEIYIKKSLSELEEILPASGKVFVIIDKNLQHFEQYFRNYNIIPIECSEQNKTLSTVEKISNKLLDMGADRDAFLIGVGGGITTDITGFTASIYKRGVKFAFIPTTLLSQVDASIGGKNGVNFHSYKNILGTITQPQWVYICPQVLQTLPDKELKAGVAEALKTFILFDAEYYRKGVEFFRDGAERDMEQLGEIIGKCAQYKCGVVQRDEFERGERRLLNLGHTFAHSIEKLTQGVGVSHGYAVSMGMVIAAKVADKLGVAESGFTQMLIADLQSTGLPALLEDCKATSHLKIADLAEAVKKDKKVTGENIHFILPKGLERVEDITISLDKIKEIANDLC